MNADVYSWILALETIAFTATAAYIDYRTQRIPNKLTLPFFAIGWLFVLFNPQGILYGLGDGLTGFLVGFGMFFLLWIVGSGGGGDAKMVGAVAVWLGLYKTIALIIISTLMVILGTGLLMLYSMLTKGVYKTKREFLPGENDPKRKKGHMELLEIHRRGRGRAAGMSYGLSVAIATVIIPLIWPAVVRVDARMKETAAAKAAAQLGTDESQSAEAASPGDNSDTKKNPESGKPVGKSEETKADVKSATESETTDAESKTEAQPAAASDKADSQPKPESKNE